MSFSISNLFSDQGFLSFPKPCVANLLIVGLAGGALLALGLKGYFGPIGSTGFLASLSGGGFTVGFSLSSLVTLAVLSARSPKKELSLLESLSQKIKETPLHQPTESSNLVSLFNHAHEILPGVYLGDYTAYQSIDPAYSEKFPLEAGVNEMVESHLLTQIDFKGCSDKNITTVITVTQLNPQTGESDPLSYKPRLQELGVHQLRIPVDDVVGAWKVIEENLDKAFQHIDKAVKGDGNVLVHCAEGASRSAAVMCAYLMSRCSVTFEEAYNYLQSIRHKVKFREDMEDGLKAYERRLIR